jgi:hypothetical protein
VNLDGEGRHNDSNREHRKEKNRAWKPNNSASNRVHIRKSIVRDAKRRETIVSLLAFRQFQQGRLCQIIETTAITPGMRQHFPETVVITASATPKQQTAGFDLRALFSALRRRFFGRSNLCHRLASIFYRLCRGGRPSRDNTF